jgi:hypothetical protein
MTFINFMGLLMCLTGILCHVSFKFAKSAKDLASVNSVSAGLGEVRVNTEDDLPLLANANLSHKLGDYGESGDETDLWTK